MTEQSDEFLALHRYYIWANRMRVHFDRVLESGAIETESGEFESFLYMSYWYGGLHVVVEGWRKLGLSDNMIDNLIASPNANLLRRYRNGVFHFQKNYNDQRFTEFMTEGIDSVVWVRDLNEKLGSYFLAVLAERKAKFTSRAQ